MAIKAGVWIDHRQAIVVLVTDAGQEIKKIKSGIEKPVRSAGRSSSKNKYTPNDFVAEDRLEHKFVNHLNKYYDEVIAGIGGAEAILILGPGEAKGEFSKRIKSKKLRGGIVELETTDKMTDGAQFRVLTYLSGDRGDTAPEARRRDPAFLPVRPRSPARTRRESPLSLGCTKLDRISGPCAPTQNEIRNGNRSCLAHHW